MHHSKSKKQKEEIFNEDSSSPQQQRKQEQEQVRQEEEREEEQEEEEEEEDEDELRGEASASEEGEVVEAGEAREGAVYDSSEEDEQRLQKEKRKREQQQRQREEEQVRFALLSQEDLLTKALEDIERTSKRIALMRKKNAKRMEDIEKVRMTQQPYLVTSNTHYRGSPAEYPLLTVDKGGKAILHPNYSLKVGEMRLADFIQKNIKEESSANYLNEVVKFENYAYQQRKKRRQHIE